MRFLIPLLSFALFASACAAAQRPNVLFIAIDDLRGDLGAFGVAHARTPELDAFARTARVFTRHYAQTPTCGASRYSLLSGRYPRSTSQIGNNAIRDSRAYLREASIPAVFRQHGYRTLALGKITHYPGGLTGTGWAEGVEEAPEVWDRSWIPESPWRTPQAMMHGYANGQPRQTGKSLPWEEFDGPDEAYPDAWIASEAVATLKDLATQKEPWFFGVGFFKPHLPFAAPKKWHDLHADGIPDLAPAAAAKPSWRSGWHRSGEFRGNYASNPNPDTDVDYARVLRRAYAASVSYTDAQVGRVLKALQEAGLEEKTIVVIWSDHGFLLGEHAIWGKHCLFEQALRSPLMIRHGHLPQPGKSSSALVESVDLFPTLADLCGISAPAGVDGRSLRSQLNDPGAPATKPAYGFWTQGQRTVRTDRWRLIEHPEKNGAVKHIELFDYATDPSETGNHAAANLDVVKELSALLEDVPAITTGGSKIN